MLDRGSARTPRQYNNQRVAQQPEPTTHRSSSSEPPTGNLEYKTPEPRRPIGSNKKLGLTIWIIAVVIVVIVVVTGCLIYSKSANYDIGIDKDKYQAVFLAGGQVYFGRMEVVDGDYLKLIDVFYPQLSATSQDSSTGDSDNINNVSDNSSSSLKLTKLGGEIHGPEDKMVINRQQVLFIENLKPDSKVVQLIKDHKLGNK